MSRAIAQETAKTVSSFISKIKKLEQFSNCFYTFRGEANKNWDISPGIMRQGRQKLLENERDAVRDLISVHPNEFLNDETMFDRLVRMQHFGLPTRLMDVTANPLVALYNATDTHKENRKFTVGRVMCFVMPNDRKKYYNSDTVSCVSNLANMSADEKVELLRNKRLKIEDFNDGEQHKASDRLLQFIRAEKPSFRPIINARELDMLWYVIPKLSNRRIIAQNGAFIIFGLTSALKKPKTFLPIQMVEILIPHGCKKTIREDLAVLGISESSLFPEIDKAAGFVMRRYK